MGSGHYGVERGHMFSLWRVQVSLQVLYQTWLSRGACAISKLAEQSSIKTGVGPEVPTTKCNLGLRCDIYCGTNWRVVRR